MPACVSQLQSEKLISEAEHREFSSLSKSQESIWRIYEALLEMYAVRPLGQLAQWLTYCQLICVNVQAFLNPKTDLFSAVTSIWSNSMEESWPFASRGEVQWCLPQMLTADLNSCLYWKWLFFLLPDKASRKQTTGFGEHLHERKHATPEKELIYFWVTISDMSLSVYTDT